MVLVWIVVIAMVCGVFLAAFVILHYHLQFVGNENLITKAKVKNTTSFECMHH